MFQIPKQDWMGCALATAAMIADVTYEQAAACTWKDIAKSRWTHEFLKLLENLTGTTWGAKRPWRRQTIGQFQPPDFPVAVFITDSRSRPQFGQWIAVRGRLIHDPQYHVVFSIEQYPLKDWFVAEVLRPTHPDQLRYGTSKRIPFVLEELAAEMAGLSPCRD